MTEDQIWLVAAVVAVLLVALAVVVSTAIAGRARATSEARLRAHIDERVESLQSSLRQHIETQSRQARDQLEASLSQLSGRLDNEQHQRRQLQASFEALRGEVLRQVDTRFAEQSQRVQQSMDSFGRRLGEAQQAAERLAEQLAEAQRALQETGARLDRAEDELRLARLQAALEHAVTTGFKARTHLAEQNSGLAEHDLTELEDDLERVLALAPADLRPQVQAVQRGVRELKESVEARTFPVAAVEMLTDRIRALIPADRNGHA